MDHYKLLAGIYDPILHIALNKIRKQVVQTIDSIQPDSIIDICCGTGNQLKYLKKHGFDNITGVDISESMLNQAGKGKEKVTCKNQDATRLSYSNDQFDVGIISLALHEKPIETATKILDEAFRVIKPGGYLMLVDYVFDEKTHPWIKIPVHVVERFAGKDHYKYFREYLRYGGMDKLTDSREFEKEYRFHKGATMMRLYRIGKEQYA